MNPKLHHTAMKLAVANDPVSLDVIRLGQSVLATEINGLKALEASINGDFAKAVECLKHVAGRVIITGMGKSGHIGRKIASTLSSTGTPSQYVHPSEASHGDLGMITANDAVIAISNSGETAELSDILAYCKRFSIPLIAITKNRQSALGQIADVNLQLPDAAEACPMGLAPTTSTTMALALGDALALCLLEQKGFSADQFRDLHPGGKLGQRLLKVCKIMHSGNEIPIAKPTDLMREVLITMTARRFGCVAIIDPVGRLLGVITDGDLRRKMNDDILNAPAAEIMTVNPTTISSQSLAAEALGIMNQKSITCLFVVDDDRLQGIVHIHDCLRAGVM